MIGAELCLGCGGIRTPVCKCPTGAPAPTTTPVEAIRERLEYLREQKARVARFITGRPDLTTIESPIDGEIAGLEFALRAMGVSE